MMVQSSIPVDFFNPGQVFASLGFLEAADMLCGDAEGRFDWSDETDVRFCLHTSGSKNPFAEVLEFLTEATLEAISPRESEVFPSASPDSDTALPVRIVGKDKKQVVLEHWADGSSRNEFKLYAGNRSAYGIACNMQSKILELWRKGKSELIEAPFDITIPMKGSFNFDPRGAWTAIDAGYSPNEQKHLVNASPVVEILAAWGMQNARPDEFHVRKIRYTAWGIPLPSSLARVALVGGIGTVPMKRFRFDLHMSGKNKIVTFAEKEVGYG